MRLTSILLLFALSSCRTLVLSPPENPVLPLMADRDRVDRYVSSEFLRMGMESSTQVYEVHGVVVRNAIGVVEGDERVILIGAHHDRVEGSPGADDNASGVAVLLEVANRLRLNRVKPTLVFIAFGGEEMGTLGSIYYSRNPVLPLDRSVAMINMDMVGRLRETLAVIGVDTAKEWHGHLDRASLSDLPLKRGKGGVGPSDHTPFYLAGIPVLHLLTGAHSDYHKSTDTADKLNVSGMSRIADFVEKLVREIANGDGLTYQKSSVQVRPAGGPVPKGNRPYLGVIPDYTFDGKGVFLQGTNPGSPAESAGFREGDLVLSFDGTEVPDIQVYSKLFFATRPGDKLVITVLREGKRVDVSVTIGTRPK